MITPEEIAEARELCEKSPQAPWLANPRQFVETAQRLLPRLLDALESERERGAGIAEAQTTGGASPDPDLSLVEGFVNSTCRDIAAAIRSGQAPGKD